MFVKLIGNNYCDVNGILFLCTADSAWIDAYVLFRIDVDHSVTDRGCTWIVAVADVKCCSSKSFRKSVFCHQSVIHTPLIQKKVINTHNQHPLIIVIRCWCIFCDNNLLEEIASQHQETLLLKVRLQNIRVTKTLILKGIKCNFYNVLFIRSFCKQMILK